jgi:hypothetical protein
VKLLFIASLYPPDTLGGAEVALANRRPAWPPAATG